MTAIANRYEFVMLFDVENGNPNGDPDAGNMPRIDPETGHGLVTDVCLKRKIRNYVEITREGQSGYEIYVKDGVPLNAQHKKAYLANELEPSKDLPKDVQTAQKLTGFMCQNFYDVRTFGAVMSTKVNCGQAVSYTHLDVYKRQAFGGGQGRLEEQSDVIYSRGHAQSLFKPQKPHLRRQ